MYFMVVSWQDFDVFILRSPEDVSCLQHVYEFGKWHNWCPFLDYDN